MKSSSACKQKSTASSRRRSPDAAVTLYHFTDIIGLHGILKTGELRPSVAPNTGAIDPVVWLTSVHKVHPTFGGEPYEVEGVGDLRDNSRVCITVNINRSMLVKAESLDNRWAEYLKTTPFHHKWFVTPRAIAVDDFVSIEMDGVNGNAKITAEGGLHFESWEECAGIR